MGMVVHRDISPARLTLTHEPLENPDNLHGLKVVDFVYAHVMREGLRLQTQHGDPLHRAPEIFDNDYGFGVDVWSAGITMYRVVTGALPFHFEVMTQLLEKMERERPTAAVALEMMQTGTKLSSSSYRTPASQPQTMSSPTSREVTHVPSTMSEMKFGDSGWHPASWAALDSK